MFSVSEENLSFKEKAQVEDVVEKKIKQQDGAKSLPTYFKANEQISLETSFNILEHSHKRHRDDRRSPNDPPNKMRRIGDKKMSSQVYLQEEECESAFDLIPEVSSQFIGEEYQTDSKRWGTKVLCRNITLSSFGPDDGNSKINRPTTEENIRLESKSESEHVELKTPTKNGAPYAVICSPITPHEDNDDSNLTWIPINENLVKRSLAEAFCC